MKDSLRDDPRYKSVKHEDREVLFNDYLSDLRAAEEQVEKEAKAKREEQVWMVFCKVLESFMRSLSVLCYMSANIIYLCRSGMSLTFSSLSLTLFSFFPFFFFHFKFELKAGCFYSSSFFIYFFVFKFPFAIG